MSSTTTTRTLPAIAAAAIGIATLFVCPTTAHALPMVPLAPACGQYTFEDATLIDQTNGHVVDIRKVATTGQQFTASAVDYLDSKAFASGNVSGSFTGADISFTIEWSNGAKGSYTGKVASGVGVSARGTTSDVNRPSSQANWSTHYALACVSAPAVAKPEPGPAKKDPVEVPAPAAQLATVISDVDLYDSAGFDGNIIGILREGERYQLGRCTDGSCEVKGKGFAAEEFFRKP